MIMIATEFAVRTRTHVMNGVRGLLLIALLLTAAQLHAQPRLEVTRSVLLWPTVEVYFKAWCDSARSYDVAPQQLRLTEDGVERPPATVWCPDPRVRCAVSASLVMDAGGSMTGQGNAEMKGYGRALIDQFDGVLDEMSVIWFNTQVNIAQQMTTIKPLLYTAVDALPASGGTAIWDGAYAGLIELINNGVNQCRAMILMTDGNEGSSTRTLADVVSLANRNRIRVYTIGIGGSISDTELRSLAETTGGRYLRSPNAGDLAQLYDELSTIMTVDGECMVSFRPFCGDGKVHNVKLELSPFCGGSAADSIDVQLPLDSSSFSSVRYHLDDAECLSDSTVSMPFFLLPPPGPLPPLTLTLRFDDQCIDFTGIDTRPGTVFEGQTLPVTPVPGGVRIQTPAMDSLRHWAVLFYVNFRASTVTQVTRCDIAITDMAFSGGCHIPVADSSDVTIYPYVDEPVLECDLVYYTIGVDEESDTYNPMPFSLHLHVRNRGGVTTDSVFARITLEGDLALAGADAPDRYLRRLQRPFGPLDGQGISWQISHPVTRKEKQYTVSVTVHSANADSTHCSVAVTIPAVEINPFPFTLTAEGPTELCAGDSVTLVAGDGYLSYAWNTGDSTRRIVTGEDGAYFCSVKDSAGYTGLSDTVDVIVHPLPDPTVTALGSRIICSNESVWLVASPGYRKYAWNTGDTTQRIEVRDAGGYRVTVTDEFGCRASSDTLTVEVLPAPPKPVLTRSGDDLTSTPAATYRWLRNGILMMGDTSRVLHVTETGRYAVVITAENGCRATSDEILVTTLDAFPPAVPAAFHMEAWPDPVKDILHCALSGPPGRHVRVMLSDVLGRTTVLYEGNISSGELQLSVSMQNRTSGPFFLLLITPDNISSRKLMKE
ncbi:MAG: VWA domain-containing protein [Bacteroidota bacterium]|nr:VWA domain-containing protein [Bacteroidota bacterium]